MLAFHLTKSPSFSVSSIEYTVIARHALMFIQVLQIFIFFVIFLVHIYAQPYKKAWHNWLEAFLLAYIIILLSMRSTNASLNLLSVYINKLYFYCSSSSLDHYYQMLMLDSCYPTTMHMTESQLHLKIPFHLVMR